MVIAQAAAEYGMAAGIARGIDSLMYTVDGFIAQVEISNWAWAALVLLIIHFAFRAPR